MSRPPSSTSHAPSERDLPPLEVIEALPCVFERDAHDPDRTVVGESEYRVSYYALDDPERPHHYYRVARPAPIKRSRASPPDPVPVLPALNNDCDLTVRVQLGPAHASSEHALEPFLDVHSRGAAPAHWQRDFLPPDASEAERDATRQRLAAYAYAVHAGAPVDDTRLSAREAAHFVHACTHMARASCRLESHLRRERVYALRCMVWGALQRAPGDAVAGLDLFDRTLTLPHVTPPAPESLVASDILRGLLHAPPARAPTTRDETLLRRARFTRGLRLALVTLVPPSSSSPTAITAAAATPAEASVWD